MFWRVQPIFSPPLRESEHRKEAELWGFECWEIKSSNGSDRPKHIKRSGGKKNKFGAEPVRATMLSEVFGSFGDFENFVNVIGKDCGEVGS